MKKLLMLSFANIRKTKSQTIALSLMFVILSMLMNLGLLVSINFGNFFDKTAKELKTSNMYYSIPDPYYTPEVENYLNHNSNIMKMEKHEGFIVSSNVKYSQKTREVSFLFLNANENKKLSKWAPISKVESLEPTGSEMPVYLPYLFYSNAGYHLNDKITIKNGEKSVQFTIKGFIEDIYFCSIDLGMVSIYMTKDTYEKALAALSVKSYTKIIFAELKKVNKTIESDLKEISRSSSVVGSVDMSKSIYSLDLTTTKLSRTIMASMVSIVMVAFSIIIIIVSLIIIRFRISNSIEEDISKIGSLKSVGYTSLQVISSLILQYGFVASFGIIAGIVLSYISIPTISNVFAVQTGLKWTQQFDSKISGFTVIFLLLIVCIVSFFAAFRIRKISPITALRGGIVTHNFKRNYIPLEKSKGILSAILAAKSNLQSIKQSIMIIIIMLAVGFSGAFGVVVFYNTVMDTTNFAQVPGAELSNIVVHSNNLSDNPEIITNIKKMKEVEFTQFIDSDMLKIDNIDSVLFIMKDFSTKKTNTVYQGRYPKHDNEIVLSYSLAKMLERKVGDNVELKNGNVKYNYIVSGLSQGFFSGPYNASLTLDGFKKLKPEFQQSTLQIYLKKGSETTKVAAVIDGKYKSKVVSVTNFDKLFQEGMGPYVDIMSKIGLLVIVVTVAVVLLVLYFVIVSSVIRKRRELGIQKALGFTTFQLMNQVSLSFVFPVLIGLLLGCFLGIIGTNPVMSLGFSSGGIMKSHFIIRNDWIAGFGFTTLLISYLTSLVITWRIRKISAYALVNE